MFPSPLLHSVVTVNRPFRPPASSGCPRTPASPASLPFHLHRCGSQRRPRARPQRSRPPLALRLPRSHREERTAAEQGSVMRFPKRLSSSHGLTSGPVSPRVADPHTSHLPKWHLLDVFRRLLTSATLQTLFPLCGSFPTGWAPTRTRAPARSLPLLPKNRRRPRPRPPAARGHFEATCWCALLRRVFFPGAFLSVLGVPRSGGPLGRRQSRTVGRPPESFLAAACVCLLEGHRPAKLVSGGGKENRGTACLCLIFFFLHLHKP